MAYNRNDIYERAIKDIKEHNLYRIQDVVAFSPCVSSTFYEFFPADSEESETIKELLGENRIRTKTAIKAKLYNSDKAAELIALYKLLADDDERDALSMQRHEHSGKAGAPIIIHAIPDGLKNDSNK